MCFPWACRTILQLRLKKGRRVYAYVQGFLETGQPRSRRGRGGPPETLRISNFAVAICWSPWLPVSVVESFDDCDSGHPNWSHFRGESSPTRKKEWHHRRSWRRPQSCTDCPANRRTGQRSLPRILGKSFGCASFLDCHSCRPKQ